MTKSNPETESNPETDLIPAEAPDTALQDLLDEIRDHFYQGSVAVLTGAGISAESGITTYRDHDLAEPGTALWDEVDPREMATPRAFRKNRNRVWRWYMGRVRQMRRSQPNDAHHILAAIAQVNPGVRLYTQNVDGLHERAGSDVQRLHGSAVHYRCRCGHQAAIPEDLGREPWPLCGKCGSTRTRPDTVWFGESLPKAVIDSAWSDFTNADLKVVIGTSAVVTPVAYLPRLGKGIVVEINPEQTALTRYSDVRVPAGASRGLEFLLNN